MTQPRSADRDARCGCPLRTVQPNRSERRRAAKLGRAEAGVVTLHTPGCLIGVPAAGARTKPAALPAERERRR